MSPTLGFAFCALPAVIGLLAAIAIHMGLVLPAVGTGSPDLNRMIALGVRLDTPLDEEPTLVFLGDSLTVEGIDAETVREAAPPGWRVFNFAINGGDRAELDIIIPKVAKAKPAAVCMILRPLSIAYPPDVGVDGAYAYNLGGFAKAWPAGWIPPYPPGVSKKYAEMLQESTLEAQLHFRTALQQLINSRIRQVVRSGFRSNISDDWQAPFNMTTSIGGDLLNKHLRTLGDELVDGVAAGTSVHEADLERLVAHLHSQGITPILVSSPTHPKLREIFGPTAEKFAALAKAWVAKYDGIYADAHFLLDETGFADGQHLNEKGRNLLSRFVAAALPPPDQLGKGSDAK